MVWRSSVSVVNFYPRPPRGGRPQPQGHWNSSLVFLSTPSARRATRSCAASLSRALLFLSTPSARRATLAVVLLKQLGQISIHALREEGDACSAVMP